MPWSKLCLGKLTPKAIWKGGLKNYLTRSWEDSSGDIEVIQVRDGGGMDVCGSRRGREEEGGMKK